MDIDYPQRLNGLGLQDPQTRKGLNKLNSLGAITKQLNKEVVILLMKLRKDL